MPLSKENWTTWCRKELICTLQAKGKLEKPTNEASARREKAYQDTANRLFPAVDEDGTMTQQLMAEARAKLASSAAATAAASTPTTRGAATASSNTAMTHESRHHGHHAALKEKLKHMEGQVAAERQARQMLQAEICQLRSSTPPAHH
eukprot:jgi/Chrzof1/14851/Cz09g18130.t1